MSVNPVIERQSTLLVYFLVLMKALPSSGVFQLMLKRPTTHPSNNNITIMFPSDFSIVHMLIVRFYSIASRCRLSNNNPVENRFSLEPNSHASRNDNRNGRTNDDGDLRKYQNSPRNGRHGELRFGRNLLRRSSANATQTTHGHLGTDPEGQVGDGEYHYNSFPNLVNNPPSIPFTDSTGNQQRVHTDETHPEDADRDHDGSTECAPTGTHSNATARDGQQGSGCVVPGRSRHLDAANP